SHSSLHSRTTTSTYYTPHLTLSIHLLFLNDTPTTEIYTLSLHDALPICSSGSGACSRRASTSCTAEPTRSWRKWISSSVQRRGLDRKSTRLNSSHVKISYAVFCLKKKRKKKQQI